MLCFALWVWRCSAATTFWMSQLSTDHAQSRLSALEARQPVHATDILHHQRSIAIAITIFAPTILQVSRRLFNGRPCMFAVRLL